MKKPLTVVAATTMATVLAACGSSAEDDGKTSVVSSFYATSFVAERVGGSLVDIETLTSPGTEPHDLQLRPKQVAAVQDADLVVYEKHFQAAVDEAVDQAGRHADDTVDFAALVSMLPTQAAGEDAEHKGEKEHHADDGHDHGDEDPHIWLDPTSMIALTEAISERLSDLDPAHAAEFGANADQLVAELKTLDTEFTEGLKNCRTRTIVTSHAAFQYLAARYGLKQVAIAGVDPTNEPSPAQLGTITELVRAEKITTIFTEELVSPAIADTIAKETGATTATLDPIEGLSDATKGENYLTLMRKNLDHLKKANSCS